MVRPGTVELVEAADRRLEHRHTAAGRRRPRKRRRHHRLADLGAGPGDEEAGHWARGLRGAPERRRPHRPPRPEPAAARPITRAAARSSSARWLAITVSRSLEVPSGTVGGRIACANTPRSSVRSQSAVARRASPTVTGTIWVRDAPIGSPLPPGPRAGWRRFPAAVRPGQAATRAAERRLRRADRRRGRGGGEDERASGVDEQLDQLARRADVGAVAAQRLPERADDQVDLALEPGGGDRAAPSGAQGAGRVGLVDREQAAVALRELAQLGERGDVAVQGSPSNCITSASSWPLRVCARRFSRSSARRTSRNVQPSTIVIECCSTAPARTAAAARRASSRARSGTHRPARGHPRRSAGHRRRASADDRASRARPARAP